MKVTYYRLVSDSLNVCKEACPPQENCKLSIMEVECIAHKTAVSQQEGECPSSEDDLGIFAFELGPQPRAPLVNLVVSLWRMQRPRDTAIKTPFAEGGVGAHRAFVFIITLHVQNLPTMFCQIPTSSTVGRAQRNRPSLLLVCC